MTHPRIRQIAPDFWNIRGSFKTAGVLEVGTQVSLIRRRNGRFVFLDSYSLPDEVDREVRALTHDGRDVEAIVNVHPFHTIHVRPMHQAFPGARLYGTARHQTRFPDLPWEPTCTEDPALHAELADDFDFSVPRGVDFISADEKVHFSSVLVLHRSSKTIHVDDTLIYVRFPAIMRLIGPRDLVRFHPTLGRALQRRAGAAGDFRSWATELAGGWGDAKNLCAAHTATLAAEQNQGPSIRARILEALDKASRTLEEHQRKYG
jgi:hypothetical protein